MYLPFAEAISELPCLKKTGLQVYPGKLKAILGQIDWTDWGIFAKSYHGIQGK